MKTDTKELPLIGEDAGARAEAVTGPILPQVRTAPVPPPLVRAAGGDRSAQASAAPIPVLRPVDVSAAPVQAPRSVEVSAAPVQVPHTVEASAVPAPASQPASENQGARAESAGAVPVAVVRPARRWPLALGSWFGGVVAGMLVLALGLALLGGQRDRPTGLGDPAAGWDTSVTLTDAALTAQARKTGTGQVQQPVLHVQADGTIALEGTMGLMGRSVPVSATLQPAVVDGKLQFSLARLQLGGLPLPEMLVKQIEGSLAGAMQSPATATDATVVKVEATQGKLAIYSRAK